MSQKFFPFVKKTERDRRFHIRVVSLGGVSFSSRNLEGRSHFSLNLWFDPRHNLKIISSQPFVLFSNYMYN